MRDYCDNTVRKARKSLKFSAEEARFLDDIFQPQATDGVNLSALVRNAGVIKEARDLAVG